MPKIFIPALLLSCALVVGHASAQSKIATIRGTVRDTEKAVIPGVLVTLTNVQTMAVFKTTSGPSGEYKFDVPAGVYELTADLPGFELAKLLNVQLKESETNSTDLTLRIRPHGFQIPLAPHRVLPPGRV